MRFEQIRHDLHGISWDLHVCISQGYPCGIPTAYPALLALYAVELRQIAQIQQWLVEEFQECFELHRDVLQSVEKVNRFKIPTDAQPALQILRVELKGLTTHFLTPYP